MGRGRAALGVGLLFLLCLGLVGLVLPLRGRLEAPGSTAVYDRKGRLLRLSLAADGRYRVASPLSAYPPDFVEALLLKEDRWFWFHPGVNPLALAKAAWHSTVARDYRAGASTITMQLARIAGAYETGTPAGKLRQAWDALRLERLYTKAEILEAYLSRAPCGGNIEGFEAASLAYFGRPLASLALSESLLLASLPQKPWTSLDKAGDPDLLAARDRLFRAWCRRHPEARAKAGEFSLPIRLAASFPFAAPHLVDSLLSGLPRDLPRPPRIDSTIDRDIQARTEAILASYVERHAPEGIHNASALLVDTRTMEVLAEVGSANFYDSVIEGQVNGCEALRSPGSALKPFLYGLAIQQGVIHPMTVLKDAPIHFSGYNPDNFDNDFEGPLTAKEALIRSRNVPAVWLMDKVADPDLHDLLAKAGISRLKPRDWYGFSLILGTAELSMKELAGLYAMLARGGSYLPVREVLDPSRGARAGIGRDRATSLFSPEAAWLVLDILREKPRPEISETVLASGRIHPDCAWKTGTSIGFRDAWSVGVSGPYVLAVWVGNFDGASNPAFVGLTAAAPLMFEVLDGLNAGGLDFSEAPWERRPPGLARVKVCAASGAIPTELCPRTVETWFIPGTSPIDRCTVHQEVLVDTLTGLRRRTALEGRTRREVMEVWPSDLMALFARAGLPRRQPPPFAHGESGEAGREAGTVPQIQSPLARSEYILRYDSKGVEIELPLLCVVPSDVSRVFWFLDDSFLGSVPPGQAFFWKPRPGEFSLRVTDDRGRSASLRFKVVLGNN